MKSWFIRCRLAMLVAVAVLLCGYAIPAGAAGALKLPAGTIEIAEKAFYGNRAVTAVTLPNGVRRIGSKAFAGTGITQVYLPGSLTYIAKDAFDGPGKVKMTCAEDSYAHDWAVENGYLAGPTITAQPVNASVATGRDVHNEWVCEDYSFSVTATGASGYQWQFSEDKGKTWYNILGATSRVYSCTPNRASLQWPYYYRCRVSGSGGYIYTKAARAVMNTKVKIHQQPQHGYYSTNWADNRRNYLVTYEFIALNAAAYQWQASDDGVTWENVGERVTTPLGSRYWERIGGKPATRKFRCKVTGVTGDTVYTNAVGFSALGSGDAVPWITSEPKEQIVKIGDAVSLSVSLYAQYGGTPQWQVSPDGENNWTDLNKSTAKEKTLSFTVGNADVGKYYRCKVSNGDDKVSYTTPVPIYGFGVTGKAKITQHPAGKTITTDGSPVELKVVAQNARLYRWQYRALSYSTEWSDYQTSESNTLTVHVYSNMDCEYRCMVIGTDGIIAYSNAAALKSNRQENQPFITIQPEDYSGGYFGNYGSFTVKFEIKAQDASTYAWQHSMDGGKTWSDATQNATYTSYYFMYGAESIAALKQERFRCKVTGPTGLVAYSKVVRVTTHDLCIEAAGGGWQYYGDEAGLQARVHNYTGKQIASATWQRSGNGGSVWHDIATRFSSNDAYVSHVNGTPESEGTLCRFAVKLSDGSMYYSDILGPFRVNANASSLYVPMQYDQQPTDQQAVVGDTVTFTMKARHVYCWCWQSSTDGKNWKLVPGSNGYYNTRDQEKGAYSLSVKVTADNIDNTLYRCRLMCWGGCVFSSESVRITSKRARITAQPADQQAAAGETATFWVRAAHAKSYQWQYSDDGSAWKDLSSASTDRFTVTASASLIGKRRFRCVITGEDGVKVTSAAAKLIAKTAGHTHSWTAIVEKSLVVDKAGYDFTVDQHCNCGFPIRSMDEYDEHKGVGMVVYADVWGSDYNYHWDGEEGLCEPLHPHRENYGGVVGDGTAYRIHVPMEAHFASSTVGYRCGCGMTKPK